MDHGYDVPKYSDFRTQCEAEGVAPPDLGDYVQSLAFSPWVNEHQVAILHGKVMGVIDTTDLQVFDLFGNE